VIPGGGRGVKHAPILGHYARGVSSDAVLGAMVDERHSDPAPRE
jgi:hypothetical protein